MGTGTVTQDLVSVTLIGMASPVSQHWFARKIALDMDTAFTNNASVILDMRAAVVLVPPSVLPPPMDCTLELHVVVTVYVIEAVAGATKTGQVMIAARTSSIWSDCVSHITPPHVPWMMPLM